MRAGWALTRDRDVIRAAVDDHPMFRVAGGFDEVSGFLGPGAVVWQTTHRGRHGIVALGDPAAALDFIVELAGPADGPVRISVPRVDHAAIFARFAAERIDDWEQRWSQADPPPESGEPVVVALRDDEFPQIEAVLRAALPTAHTRPGDDYVRQWYGVRDAQDVIAVAADCSAYGVGRINAIAVRPDFQGKGFGGALTAQVTRRLRAEHGTVQLGVMDDNVGAQRLYQRLGYTRVHRMTSFSPAAR